MPHDPNDPNDDDDSTGPGVTLHDLKHWQMLLRDGHVQEVLRALEEKIKEYSE